MVEDSTYHSDWGLKVRKASAPDLKTVRVLIWNYYGLNYSNKNEIKRQESEGNGSLVRWLLRLWVSGSTGRLRSKIPTSQMLALWSGFPKGLICEAHPQVSLGIHDRRKWKDQDRRRDRLWKSGTTWKSWRRSEAELANHCSEVTAEDSTWPELLQFKDIKARS